MIMPWKLSRSVRGKKRKSHLGRRPNRRTNKPKLSMESLERRIVLAGSVGILRGELIVIGDDAANTIVIIELQDNYVVDADFLRQPRVFLKRRVASIRVTGGEGDDTIVATSFQTPVTLEGNAGNDRLFGGQGNDLIQGGAGDDLIYGNRGNDIIFGGAGVDRVFGGEGDDVVNGGDDDDVLHGNQGDDTVDGDSGNDRLFGSQGVDNLIGGLGNDLLVGGADNDSLSGGAGNDILIGNGGSDNLDGGVGDDTLLGSGGDDVQTGGPGNDLLVGGNGDDQLNGGDGSDRLFGDSGADILTGGNGNDVAFGGTGPDTLFGNNGDDELNGGIGFDILSGQSGADKLYGGDFRDILIGGTGDDLVSGQGSEDLLVPGVTNTQSSAVALNAARAIWTSSASFGDRTMMVFDGVGVFPETSADRLIGGSAQDVYFAASRAQIVDKKANEPIVDNRFVAVNDSYDLAIGETITTTLSNGVLSNDIIPGGGNVTAAIVTPAAHGSVSFNPDGTFSYTQSTIGRDSFVYEYTAQNGIMSRATVRITVPGLPPLPDGVTLTTTDSGLEVYDFSTGTGDMPVSTDTVTVEYAGRLPDGSIFDSNMMVDFPLSGLIEGFAEGVEGMRVGGMRRIVIPPDLGYGAGGNPGAGIGGMDVITFDVTLIAIV